MPTSLEEFIQQLLRPPPRPPFQIPWTARGYGARINAGLDAAWKLCYEQGLAYGFLAGVLTATIVFVLFGRSGKVIVVRTDNGVRDEH